MCVQLEAREQACSNERFTFRFPKIKMFFDPALPDRAHVKHRLKDFYQISDQMRQTATLFAQQIDPSTIIRNKTLLSITNGLLAHGYSDYRAVQFVHINPETHKTKLHIKRCFWS